MKENSIEEDIKIVENYLANSAINETDSDFFKEGGWEVVDLEIPKSMKHILSDYKRVLKENRILKEEKEQAWEEWNNLEQGSYETEQKLKQQIKESQKENEELKNQEATQRKINELLVQRYSNSISKQKVKDKIEEIKKEKNKFGNCLVEFYENELADRDIKILQELLNK